MSNEKNSKTEFLLGLEKYIEENIIDNQPRLYSSRSLRLEDSQTSEINNRYRKGTKAYELEGELEEIIKMADDTFSKKLLKHIDESGRSDIDVYKAADIDRRLFSKIRSDVNYSPSKKTALSFAIALKLNMKDTEDLLSSAGYTLSSSNVSDLIIKYFIINDNFDIHEINLALERYKQSPLCS